MRKLFALLPLLGILSFSGAQAMEEGPGGGGSGPSYYSVIRSHTAANAISDQNVSQVAADTQFSVASAAATQTAVSAAFLGSTSFSPSSVFDNLLTNYWADLKSAANGGGEM